MIPPQALPDTQTSPVTQTPTTPNPIRMDQTRTVSVRSSLRGRAKRFVAGLKRVVRDALIDQDAMAFMALHDFPVAFSVFFPWRFVPPADRVKLFAAWFSTELDTQVARPLVALLGPPAVENVVRSGASRGYDDAVRSRKALALPAVTLSGTDAEFTAGGKEQYLRSLLYSNKTSEEVKLFRQRAGSDVEGITAAVKAQVFRAASDAVDRRDGAPQLVENVSGILDDVLVRRWNLLVLSETVRWYTAGQLLAAESLGVRKVTAQAEQKSNGTACASCAKIGTVSVSEAWGRLPAHVGCSCVWLPSG